MKEESMKHGPFDSVKVTCLVFFFLLKLAVFYYCLLLKVENIS